MSRNNIFRELKNKQHDEDFVAVKAKQPTHHYPGTQGKIEVIRQRVENGEELFHEDDARLSEAWLQRAPEQVRKIREHKGTSASIAREMGISERHAGAIRKNEYWKHLKKKTDHLDAALLKLRQN